MPKEEVWKWAPINVFKYFLPDGSGGDQEVGAESQSTSTLSPSGPESPCSSRISCADSVAELLQL